MQPKAIAHPVDSRLLEIARDKVVSAAKRAGIALRQTFAKEDKTLRRKAGGYGHARQFMRLRKVVNPGVQIIHRGKYKSLSEHERRLLKRRQAIELLIGHTKADHRMDRCWLQGALADALHALSCAAGYNIRWLLRAISRLG